MEHEFSVAARTEPRPPSLDRPSSESLRKATSRESRACKHIILISIYLLLPLAFVTSVLAVPDKLPAFPGAEGFGAYAKGGRGGEVLFVTNLNDSGPGSLRAACEAEGPRIVVFRVAGTIELRSGISIKNPYITIAGQTAPGDGVCVKNDGFSISTHDVVVRYLRVRPGDGSGDPTDAISIGNGQRVIVDHCSCSWATDEVLTVTNDSKAITVQWCIIAECLHDSIHPKGPHGMGSLIRAEDGGYTIHHCIYAHNNSRNPRPGDNYGKGPGVLLDFRNNVIYNWGATCGYSVDESFRMNYVGNYLRPGPSTSESSQRVAFSIGGPDNHIYAAANELDGFPEANTDNWLLIRRPGKFTERERQQVKADEPFMTATVKTHSADEAYRLVVERAGAIHPKRDSTDRRLIGEIRDHGGRIINSQNEAGGWDRYTSADPPTDTDMDGMPDAWEEERGFNPSDASDNAGDADGDGYTNIEEYLNALAGE